MASYNKFGKFAPVLVFDLLVKVCTTNVAHLDCLFVGLYFMFAIESYIIYIASNLFVCLEFIH